MRLGKKLTKRRPPFLLLYFLGLLMAVSTALPAYIQSNFLKGLVNLPAVSGFFVIANLFTVLAIVIFPNLIRKLNNYFLIKVVLLIYGVSLLGLTAATSALAGFIAIILFTIASNLIWINLDVALETFSKNPTTGRTRATYFTFINLGWIGAPALSSYLIKLGDYQLVFLSAALLVIPLFLIVLSQKRRLNDRVKYSRERLALVIKKTWQNKNLRGIFFIALLLSLFYGCAVVYIPLYLHQTLGMDWHVLGPIFSLMLIPFVLFELPAGIVADKYWGEKELLSIGLTIIIIALFLFFLIDQPTAWVWTAVLFFSRIGASLMEAMRESYFFKIVNADDVGYINLFRTAAPLGYALGPAIAIICLSFLPLPYLFLILAILMLSGFGFIASLKDTK